MTSITAIARQVAETTDLAYHPSPDTGAYEPIIEDYEQLVAFIEDGIRAYLTHLADAAVREERAAQIARDTMLRYDVETIRDLTGTSELLSMLEAAARHALTQTGAAA